MVTLTRKQLANINLYKAQCEKMNVQLLEDIETFKGWELRSITREHFKKTKKMWLAFFEENYDGIYKEHGCDGWDAVKAILV